MSESCCFEVGCDAPALCRGEPGAGPETWPQVETRQRLVASDLKASEINDGLVQEPYTFALDGSFEQTGPLDATFGVGAGRFHGHRAVYFDRSTGRSARVRHADQDQESQNSDLGELLCAYVGEYAVAPMCGSDDVPYCAP